jgi:hypothetical protein
MSGTVAAHPEKHQQAAASQVCAGKLSAITVQRMKVLSRLPKRAWCACLSPQTPTAAARECAEELRELLTCRTRAELSDEWSDITFAVGRLCGAVIGRRYVPVPYSGRHIEKIRKRHDEYGCVRSARHLHNGRCPNP